MADPGRPPVSVAAHAARVVGTVAPLPPVRLPLELAVGAVLAEDAVATEALPRFDHAAMDGYAVRAADVAGATGDAPVSLPVVGVIAAGDAWEGSLESGTALRIMTGAAVPAGADAVVPFEWTDRGDAAGGGSGRGRVRIAQEPVAGRHIRRAGEDVAAGAVAVTAGTVLVARHLGLLAAVGRRDVVVRPRPRVAVVSTGAELVGGDAVGELGADAVLDANTVALVAATRQVGADAEGFGPVADDLHLLQQQVERAAEKADLVVTTGGVSAGDHDVVKAALRGRVGFWFGSVAVKPGRPQGVGVLTTSDGRRVPVVSLPGTPVAAFTTFHLFVVPALRVLAGRSGGGMASAVLGAPVTGAPDRTVVLPASYDDRGRVVQLPGHVGHSQHLLARAEALLVVPPGAGLLEGDSVAVVPL